MKLLNYIKINKSACLPVSGGVFFVLVPEVSPGQFLQAGRHGTVHGGLTALCGSLHEQQGRRNQQEAQHGERALEVTTQFSKDHTRVETERRHAGA